MAECRLTAAATANNVHAIFQMANFLVICIWPSSSSNEKQTSQFRFWNRKNRFSINRNVRCAICAFNVYQSRICAFILDCIWPLASDGISLRDGPYWADATLKHTDAAGSSLFTLIICYFWVVNEAAPSTWKPVSAVLYISRYTRTTQTDFIDTIFTRLL